MSSETKKYRGVNVPTLEYFVNDTAWKINPEGYLPKYADKMEGITEDFAEKVKSGKLGSKELVIVAKQVNREILEIALIGKSAENPNGFDFDDTVEKFGWKVIDGMVVDLKLFLVNYGGKDEYLLLKQRSKEAKQNGFLGIEV